MTVKPTYEELERWVQGLETTNTLLEKKLHEASLFSEEMMTYMTEGLVLTDTRGTVIFINQRLSEMLGYLSEEIIGKCLLDLVPADQHAIAKEAEARRAQGHTDRYEIILHRKDGHKFLVLIGAGPRFDKQSGEFIGTMGVVTDITKSKQAEKDLLRERERLASILEGTNVGSWEWNVQTGETIFNERWAEILGYSLEELSPVSIDTWMKFTHPDDLKTSEELLQRHFSCELNYYECEARIRHKNGEWVWVLDSGRSLYGPRMENPCI